MRLPFRIRIERQVTVHLDVELGFESGRLADLVQLLARSGTTITDLLADRSMYHLGMPERSTEVTFLAKNSRHRREILRNLSEHGFRVREL